MQLCPKRRQKFSAIYRIKGARFLLHLGPSFFSIFIKLKNTSHVVNGFCPNYQRDYPTSWNSHHFFIVQIGRPQKNWAILCYDWYYTSFGYLYRKLFDSAIYRIFASKYPRGQYYCYDIAQKKLVISTAAQFNEFVFNDHVITLYIRCFKKLTYDSMLIYSKAKVIFCDV